MTRRRLGTPAFTTGTRGRSLLNRWTYGGRSSSPVDDLYYPELYRPHFTTFYDTTGEENDIRKSVNRELSFSAHAVDDGYDIASKSRNRDAHLLREANKALPSSRKPAHKEAGSERTVSIHSSRRFPNTSVESLNVPRTGNISQKLNSGDRTSRLSSFELLRRRFTARETPIRTPSVSPYQSPRESPDRELGHRHSLASHRQKDRFSTSRNRIGKAYSKMPSNISKNPYEDSDSIISDTEDTITLADYEKYQNYPISSDGVENIETFDTGVSTYQTTLNARERSSSPMEYLAYQPRKKVDFDEDIDEFRYKSSVPNLPNFSVIPYRPPDIKESSVANDVRFHNIVAQTAAKAREALRNVNLEEYDSAALVLSVEGEMKDPVRGNSLGFQYIARPLPLKGPMLAGPASYAVHSSDNDFSRYLNDISSFRQGIRDRLLYGYSTLKESLRLPRFTRSYRYLPSIDYGKDNRQSEYSYPYSSALSHRKRPDEELNYGDSLRLYPLQRQSRALSTSDALPDHCDAMELYESRGDELQLSTLERIKIKAAIVGNKVDVVLPSRHRPKSEYAASKIRRIKKEQREQTSPPEDTTGLSASKPRSRARSEPVRTITEEQEDHIPMSDVRRRVRRVIRKNLRDPKSYK